MCVGRAETASETFAEGGGLSLRDVVAPRLEDLRAALQQVGALIRLNHPSEMRYLGPGDAMPGRIWSHDAVFAADG